MTISILSPASCSASSKTAPVVAATSRTMVRRFPGRDECGTRVHTIPEAFATSIAATRSKTCSYSWSSISCGSSITGPSSSHRHHQGTHADARGPRSGTEILTGVLEATMRDP